MITAEQLRAILQYDPNAGHFIRIVSPRRRCVGRKVGEPDGLGRICINIGGKTYHAHRLAWLYMTGEWPEIIDHINLDPGDNRWVNLRNVSKRINQENRRTPSKNNKTGFLGVSPNGERFSASIVTHRKKIHLGTFDTPQEAHAVYVAAKRKIHEGCTL